MRWVFAAIVLVGSISAAAATSRPATPTTNPMFIEAQRLVRAGNLKEIAARAERKLLVQFDGLALIQLDETIRLATLREFGRYFSRVSEPDEGSIETLAWLMSQPRVASALMMATTRFDPPERVLAVLRALRAEYREKLDEFADLAAAVCVVWDATERFGPDEDVKIDPNEVSRIFGYFTRSADRLTFDPRRLPAELLVFVVDLDLGDEELRWVAERTAHRVNVPLAFAMVPYSESVAYARSSKDPADVQSYLLPNLLRRGGGADVAAHVASQTARSAGIPAVVVRAADVSEGAIPWWVGFLRPGAAPGWDFWSARYREHAGWRAQIIDPQTNEISGEPDVALLAGLLATSLRDRLASMALVKSVDLLPAKQRVPVLGKALDLSPANRTAWYDLADVAASEKFDDQAMKPVEEILQKHVVRKNPQFATALRLRMLKGRGTIEFDRGASRVADAVRDRPELVAMVQLAVADRLLAEQRYPEASVTLKEILRSPACSPAVALSVMTRLEDALRKQDDLGQLVAIYREVFAALARPGTSKWGRTTSYYRIGARFAALLEETNQPKEAAQVRLRLENTVLSP